MGRDKKLQGVIGSSGELWETVKSDREQQGVIGSGEAGTESSGE